MLLAYVDESYDKTYYWIGGLICPESQAVSLMHQLDEVVADAAMSYRGIGTNAELHGYALLQGKDDWEPIQSMIRARIGVYSAALKAIARHDVTIMLRGVHKPGLDRRYKFPDHPHSVALAHLLERVDELAAARDEWALVIADEVGEESTHRKNLWHFQRCSTGGYRSRQLSRIVDTIHFAPSSASRLVQSADLVTYLHTRIRTDVARDLRAQQANRDLWALIESRVKHQECWYP
ncbi:MAG TPA: DUF3800 domain-containing protein [Acidimicrobiales bacterium]|nr:DUF3800 domain-containing protein [Acidimicrobiales bacterium]